MARLDDMHVNVVYTYAPETLMSAGDFGALMKAKQEIDAAWAVLAEIDQGCFAAAYQHLAPAIKALDEMLKEWRAGYAIEARRGDEYRAARNELAEQLKACQAELQAATAYTPPYAALISELGDMKRQLAQAETALANEHEKVASLREDKAYFVEATKDARQKVKRLQADKEYLARAADDAEQRNKIAYQERDEQAAIVADVDKSLAIAHKKIDELKQTIVALGSANQSWYQRWVGMNEEMKRLVASCQVADERAEGYAGKCDKLEKKVAKLEARIAKLRAAHFKIEASFDSATHIRGLAYSAICDDDELAKEQERVCGAS